MLEEREIQVGSFRVWLEDNIVKVRNADEKGAVEIGRDGSEITFLGEPSLELLKTLPPEVYQAAFRLLIRFDPCPGSSSGIVITGEDLAELRRQFGSPSS